MFITDWFPCPNVYAFTSKKKMRKFAKKRYGVDLKPWRTQGLTTELDNGKSKVNLVYISPDISKEQRAAIIAHESVHVAQNMMDSMGEERPSSEFMAYAVQCAYLTIESQLKNDNRR